MERFYTPEEVAETLRVTRRSVYEWLKTGRLRGIRAGNRWRIRREDIDVFTEGAAGQSAGETAAERRARVEAIAGKYADIPFSSEDLVHEKQLEHQQEERYWKEWLKEGPAG